MIWVSAVLGWAIWMIAYNAFMVRRLKARRPNMNGRPMDHETLVQVADQQIAIHDKAKNVWVGCLVAAVCVIYLILEVSHDCSSHS